MKKTSKDSPVKSIMQGVFLFILFNFPFISIFDKPILFWGVPFLYFGLFILWGLVIAYFIYKSSKDAYK